MNSNKIKFKKFFEAQKSYTIKAIKILKEADVDNNIPIVQKMVWAKSNNGYKIEYKLNQAWSRILYVNENMLVSLPEFKECSDIILENKKIGLHTLCLLDIKAVSGKLMEVSEAIEILEKIEKKRGKSAVKDSMLVAMVNAGAKNEKIVFGNIAKLKKANVGVPASLIVCAELNDKEKEALEKLGK